MHSALVAINIPVGKYVTRGGFNVNTVWATGFAALVVLVLGFRMRAKVTAGTPGKLQLFWESLTGAIGDQVENALGPKYRHVVPLGVTIFILVLCSDWVEILPGLWHDTDFAPSPSADVNFCYALGLTVFFATNAAGIKAKGLGKWFKDFFSPLHVIEHITRPLTLALRLFGNIFAGGIMIALLISFPIYFAPVSAAFTVLWKLFDMFIGVVQAFIFSLLTILYYQFSIETH